MGHFVFARVALKTLALGHFAPGRYSRGFWILLAKFRIPKPWIADSTSKIDFPGSDFTWGDLLGQTTDQGTLRNIRNIHLGHSV